MDVDQGYRRYRQIRGGDNDCSNSSQTRVEVVGDELSSSHPSLSQIKSVEDTEERS